MADNKPEPSLEELGLDKPVAVSSSPEKISIRSLQLESEYEKHSQRSVTTAAQPPESSENVLGIVGFVLAILGFFTLGCISPIAMIVCFCGLGKKPIGLAVAGLILSVIGSLGLVFYGAAVIIGMLVGSR